MLRFLSILCLLVGSYITLLGQTACPNCEITLSDTLSADTIFLSLAPDGQVNMPYDEDLSFRLPMTTNPVNAVDPTTPAGLDIEEIRILGVVGLPFGLQWEASQTVFPVMEQTDGCVKLCGTPLLPGLYEVQVVIEAQVFIFAQQTSVSFFVLITPAETITEGFSIENNTACGSLTTNFINNVPSNGEEGFTYFWDLGNGNTTTMENPNTQTYTTEGDYEVNYEAVVDTAGFFLTQVVIEQTDCTDFLSNPDLKFDLFDPNGDHVFTPPIVDNTTLPVTYNLLVPIGEGNYELHVIDDDGGIDGADDLCGIINFTRDLGGTLSAGDLVVTIQLIHPVDTVRSSEIVHVYPIPVIPELIISEEMPFCEGETLHLITTNYTDNLSWSLDSLGIPSVLTDTLVVEDDGEYAVFYTSENGCVSDTVIQIIAFSPLPASFVLQQNGNLIRIEDESQLPTDFSFSWYFENNFIPSATDLLLCAEVAGVYTLEIVDNTTGCSTSVSIDATYDSSINCTTAVNEIGEANVWNVYPNPFSSYLDIKNNGNKGGIIHLFDALGRQVYSERIEPSGNRLEVGNLTNGVYFYQIQTKNGQVVQNGKLIKN